MAIPIIPDSAPFSLEQRAWLNGFFAAVLTGQGHANGNGHTSTAAMPALAATMPSPAPPIEEEAFPWHDPALPLTERLQLAEHKPLPRRLMAAMAQLDCGACGYLCKTYSEAIARGEEKSLSLCSPGGTGTAKALKQILKSEGSTPVAVNGHAAHGKPTAGGVANVQPSPGRPQYDRQHPLKAKLIRSDRLTHEDAAKDTRHVVIDLLDSGLSYEPGDSLGILPLNCPELVESVLRELGSSGNETVAFSGDVGQPLREILTAQVTLSRCESELFELLARHAGSGEDRQTLEHLSQAEQNDFLGADLAEVLRRFPSARPPLEDLLGVLGKLQPRLYSISSSQKLHPREVHLTVGIVQFEHLDRWRNGVASHFLGVRSLPGDELRIFVQTSPRFRLPADPQTPIIMIGPGTGIAPFRAFLEDRQAAGTKSKAWLFFGNQYIGYDFLYRDEMSQFLDQGTLTRLDLAFSRDQAEKQYVQHKMLENGAELWQWLEAGANLYVCGDARRMALDVDQALRQIISTHGRRSPQAADEYVKSLIQHHRYHKDVY